MASEIDTTQDKPNGPVAAALIAGGIGSVILGLMTVLTEASSGIKSALAWSPAVGPLIGKSLLGVIAFAVSWMILHFVLRGKNVNFQKVAMIAFILLAVSLVFTFPPFYEMFTPKH